MSEETKTPPVAAQAQEPKQPEPRAPEPQQPQQQPQPQQAAQRPSHIAYSVRQNADGNSYSNRIGAAFEHKDKAGYTIDLVATPVDGRVMLRTPRERLDDKRADERPEPSDRDQGHEK